MAKKEKLKKPVRRAIEKSNLQNLSKKVNSKGLVLAIVERYGVPQLVIANISPSESGSIGDAFFVFRYIITHSGIEESAPSDIQYGIKVYPFKGKIMGMGTWYNNRIESVLASENIEKLKEAKK